MNSYSFVQQNEKSCPHGISLRFDCYQCAFDTVRKNNSVCPHWISKSQPCYVCQRQSKESFTQKPHIPINQPTMYPQQQNSEFVQQQIQRQSDYQMLPSLPNYTHPDSKRDYPTPINTDLKDPRRMMSVGRSDTKRVGYSMGRHLEESSFLQNQQNNMWGGSMVEQMFPRPEKSDTHMAVGTRGDKKLDFSGRNENIFLNRSMVQPDMRYGNRFFEIKPESDRQSGRRDEENNGVNRFQHQNNELFGQKDFRQAFDGGAMMGRR